MRVVMWTGFPSPFFSVDLQCIDCTWFCLQALVDGPCSGVARQALGFNKLWLTDFKLKISHSAREKQVRKAYEEANINTKWEQTAWARRIARKARRAQLTDFDRFKLKVLRQRVNIIIRSNLRQGGGTHSLACAVNTSFFCLLPFQKRNIVKGKYNQLKREASSVS